MFLSPFFLFQVFSPFLGRTIETSEILPSSCFSESFSIGNLVSCLNNYTVPWGYYTNDTYQAAQPSSEERAAFSDTVRMLLDISALNDCHDTLLPESLAKYYTLAPFHEDQTENVYCILSEFATTSDGYYLKGWGLFISRIEASNARTIHFSAPHPIFDGDTPQQAAALFSTTGAKSLLVDGRNRGALLEPTPCIHPSDPSTTYYRTDPTHDNMEPFVTTSLAIFDWQTAHGGCPSDKCGFIQLHGKAETSCPESSAFLSSGLGTSASSIAWYEDETDRPIKRIKALVPKHFDSTFVATMPSDGTGCGLTATTNVVGRVMNGIPREDVCTTAAKASTATGMFVHIEQSMFSISAAVYGNWSDVFEDAFPLS